MKNKKIIYIIFSTILLIVVVLFISSIVKTNKYNNANHELELSGSDLFTSDSNKKEKVSINISARSGTWGKIFDFNNEGLTENNYQAYQYDFSVYNNTADEVKSFSFKLTFSHDCYLASAWNGAIEFHQNVGTDNEIVETIPDLRDFNNEDYTLEQFSVEGEYFIHMNEGDYIIYIPSSVASAVEMPIEAHEGTKPGMIIYVENGQNIEESSVIIEYKLHRLVTQDVLFWVSIASFSIWFVTYIVFLITSIQIRKYNERHERDFEIINESIETFTGFIDAKDPYTNGHSKRVAIYTKLIAEKMGYQGEELDRIYYIALLHDCGKIGVRDNILGKPDRLTEEEFEIIKSHTIRGGEILSSFKSLENVGEGALYHHERYDGKGYPKGLAGERIPLIARMICVADSFDAMNSNRVYRKKLSREYIINELKKNKGTQFDPEIADIMLNLIEEGKVKMD